MEMIFESRELKPYGEYMKSEELIEGQIYFRVSFLDEEMLTSEMVPLVFIGRDLQPDGPGLYFQDAYSYIEGERYQPEDWGIITDEKPSNRIRRGHECWFEIMEDDKYTSVFEYEKALDQLLKCSLDRKKAAL